MNTMEYEHRLRKELAGLAGWDDLDPALKVNTMIKIVAASLAAKDVAYDDLVNRMLRRAYP